MSEAFVHETALVEAGAKIGSDTKVWHDAHIRTRALVGERCILGKGVFVDFDVTIADDCKLQNYACVYHGVSLARGVFVGPHAVFANDKAPRATTPDFEPLKDGDWTVSETRVGEGAAIGANATILPGVVIGKWSMVGAGAVVVHDVPPYAVVVGSPARIIGYVCRCGAKVDSHECSRCGSLDDEHPLRIEAVKG
jgi:UDP-2-acetamido-3-amino-2,3-dideoxy-glucuronate N-acetyltransferase